MFHLKYLSLVVIVAIILVLVVVFIPQLETNAFDSVTIDSVTVTGQSAANVVDIQVTGYLSPLSLDFQCGQWACDEGQWQLRDGGGGVIASHNEGYFQPGTYSYTFTGVNMMQVSEGCFVDVGNGGGASDCAFASINDFDSDGWVNSFDNCPTTSNSSQADSDGDGTGDACEIPDSDNDGVDDNIDNCPNTPNPSQTDTDNDGTGDACDSTPTGDDDNDGVDNAVDNCPNTPNPSQTDTDNDGTGDACDLLDNRDPDGDGFINDVDVCPQRGDEGFGVQENGCPPHVVLPPDDRINWQYGDLYAVVYHHTDGVVVYCYNGNTWLGMHVNQALVDSADLSQPQDIPVSEVDEAGCRVAFYILDSGEYQINIWSYEGKLYELIADSIDFEDVDLRYHDPNE